MKYLSDWESAVSSRKELSATDRAKMLLSRETREGLKMTGKCTVCSYCSSETCMYLSQGEGGIRRKHGDGYKEGKEGDPPSIDVQY